MAAKRFIIKGRVQGVGFRYFAVQAADQAGVVGTVRNLSDGSVEAIAEGPNRALDEFCALLWRGPSFSCVTSVDEQPLSPTGRYTKFAISH